LYRLQENNFIVVNQAAMTGAGGLKRVPSESLRNYQVALPSIDEQLEIRRYLDQVTTKLNQLVSRAENAIWLLQERRTALISAAVTGKIDVRNWQPNTSTQSDEPDLPMAAEQAGRYHV